MGGMLSSDLRKVQFGSKGQTKTFNLNIEPGDNGNQHGDDQAPNSILLTPAVITRFHAQSHLNVQFKTPDETTFQIDPESHMLVENKTNLDLALEQKLMVENQAKNIETKTEVKINPEKGSIHLSSISSNVKTPTQIPYFLANQIPSESEKEETKDFSNYEQEQQQ